MTTAIQHVYDPGGPMPAEPKTKRETWLDLLPPGAPRPSLDALLTRDDLIEDLQRRGIEITPVTLAFWERTGVLPRAVRRYRGGRAQTLYPWFAVNAIAQVRDLQAAGNTLENIAAIIRMWALSSIPWADPLAEALTSAREGVTPLARAYGAAGVRVTLVNEGGDEIGAHEFPIPPE